jgi:hypothetical protein
MNGQKKTTSGFLKVLVSEEDHERGFIIKKQKRLIGRRVNLVALTNINAHPKTALIKQTLWIYRTTN